jgi:hypothetical protein
MLDFEEEKKRGEWKKEGRTGNCGLFDLIGKRAHKSVVARGVKI